MMKSNFGSLLFVTALPKSFFTALVVGSILTSINHGDMIYPENTLTVKIVLTYWSYCVTTWGAITELARLKKVSWKKDSCFLKGKNENRGFFQSAECHWTQFLQFRTPSRLLIGEENLEIVRVNDNFRKFFPVLGNVSNAYFPDVLVQLGVSVEQVEQFVRDINEKGWVLIPKVPINMDGSEKFIRFSQPDPKRFIFLFERCSRTVCW